LASYTAWQLDKKERGLCVNCGGTKTTAKLLCEPCSEKSRQWKKDRRDIRLEKRMCQECGSPDLLRGRTRCAPCFEKTLCAATRCRRRKLEAKLCRECGKVPHISGSQVCADCYFKRTAYQRLGNPALWEGLKQKLADQDFRCPYSGEHLVVGVNTSLDHMLPISLFPERSGDIDNTVWTTRCINKMKGTMSRNEFLSAVRAVYSYNER